MPLVVAQFVVFFFLSKRWVLNFPGGHHVLLLAVTCSATCGGLRRWFFLAVKWLSHSGLLGAILYPEKKVQKYWKPLKTGRISSSVCVVWVAAWQCWQIGCFFFFCQAFSSKLTLAALRAAVARMCASKLSRAGGVLTASAHGSPSEHPSAVRLSCDYCRTPAIYLWSLLVVLGRPQTTWKIQGFS